MSKPRTWLQPCVLAVVLGATFGCEAPDLGAKSSIDELRILGLRASAQLVQPGQNITLEALWVDVQSTDEGILSAWFAGCRNPEFGALEGCLEELNQLHVPANEEWPERFRPHYGDRVEVTVDSRLLDGRKEYGIGYYFFAVCRGKRFVYTPSQYSTLPLLCLDAQGRAVRAPNFRVGYRTVTAIPAVPASPPTNPVLEGFDVNGTIYPPHCRGSECRGAKDVDCEQHECPVLRAARESKDSGVDENATRFGVVVRESSVGIDWLTSTASAPRTVSLTAQYFANAGEVTPDFDLVRPSTVLGEDPNWSSEPKSAVTAVGELFLWAVVYDSMGGVDWAGIGVKSR